MSGYPRHITRLNLVEPVPRRIRAVHANEVLVDTLDARYVWEWANYPQYYLPRDGVRSELLVPTGATEETPRGVVALHAFASSGPAGPAVARLVTESVRPELADTFRFEWEAVDHWFEEDEEVFVHPRNPYTRVDALRSTRSVRIELDGVVLAESASPVLVFETGLPTRYYLNRTEVRFEHLVASATVSSCPYKGTTSEYWSVELGGTRYDDLAWSYGFPTRQLLPIAGLVAFYDEQVDVFVDGALQVRPKTHFSSD
jgi:uncharacterized protein (DUF427 family)